MCTYLRSLYDVPDNERKKKKERKNANIQRHWWQRKVQCQELKPNDLKLAQHTSCVCYALRAGCRLLTTVNLARNHSLCFGITQCFGTISTCKVCFRVVFLRYFVFACSALASYESVRRCVYASTLAFIFMYSTAFTYLIFMTPKNCEGRLRQVSNNTS